MFERLKNLKNMHLLFLQAQKSFKNINIIFCELKKSEKREFIFGKLQKLKKHGFNLLQDLKCSKNRFHFFFASVKKLQKHGFNFSQA